MGSIEAMEQGSKDRYFQDAEDDIKKLCLKESWQGFFQRRAFGSSLSAGGRTPSRDGILRSKRY